MTPLTELTSLMRDYAERHGITCSVYIKIYQNGTGSLYTLIGEDKMFKFDSETDFLNKIKG